MDRPSWVEPDSRSTDIAVGATSLFSASIITLNAEKKDQNKKCSNVNT